MMKKKAITLLSFVLGVAMTVLLVVLVAASPSTPAPENPSAAKARFPVNLKGETYGATLNVPLEEYPDLIAAVGEGGVEGYIRQKEADPYEPKNPEDALRWQAEYAAQGGGHWVNLYDKEGEIIGKFRVGQPVK